MAYSSVTMHDKSTESRQRLRPWLKSLLDNNTIQDMCWINEDRTMFKIPWKHGGKQDWTPKEGEVFMKWAVHTGKHRLEIDKPNYAKWKTNLRCALNKASDIEEVKEQSQKNDLNPYKVYKFLPPKKKRSSPIRQEPDNVQTPPPSSTHAQLPTFVETEHISDERLPSDLKSVRSMDLVGEHTYDQSQEAMDLEEYQSESSPDGSSYSQDPLLYDQSNGPSTSTQAMIIPSDPIVQEINNDDETFLVDLNTYVFELHKYNNSDRECPNVTGDLKVLKVEVLYRTRTFLAEEFYGNQGCFINYGTLHLQPETQQYRNYLFANVENKYNIMLPAWPKGLCNNPEQESGAEMLLDSMQLGIIIEMPSNGDIYATRLCKASVYFSSPINNHMEKLRRNPQSPEPVKIFDFQSTYHPALLNSKNTGFIPDPFVYLCVGQELNKDQIAKALIVIKITHVYANNLFETMCDEEKTSVKISKSI